MALTTVTRYSGFAMPDADPVAANVTPLYTAQLVDPTNLDANGNPTPIPASALTALTLSIVNPSTGAIINSVNAQNILNTDRGTVDNQGNLSIQLKTNDTVLGVGVISEIRSLVIDFTYAGVKVGRHQVDFIIIALSGP